MSVHTDAVRKRKLKCLIKEKEDLLNSLDLQIAQLQSQRTCALGFLEGIQFAVDSAKEAK